MTSPVIAPDTHRSNFYLGRHSVKIIWLIPFVARAENRGCTYVKIKPEHKKQFPFVKEIEKNLKWENGRWTHANIELHRAVHKLISCRSGSKNKLKVKIALIESQFAHHATRISRVDEDYFTQFFCWQIAFHLLVIYASSPCLFFWCKWGGFNLVVFICTCWCFAATCNCPEMCIDS